MTAFDTISRRGKILLLMERKMIFKADLLSEKLKVSPRTVANEVNRLNKELDGSARIELLKGTYQLYLFDIPRFVRLRDDILRPEQDFDHPTVRLSYILEALISQDLPIVTDELAFEMDVSRSTLVGDMKKLKSLLKGYDLQIIGKTNTGIRLEGSEFNIRRFLLDNNYELVFEDGEQDMILRERFRGLMQDWRIEEMSAELVWHYLRVAVERIRSGHTVTFEDPAFLALQSFGLFPVAQSIADLAETVTGLNFPIEERLFLTIPLSGMRTPADLSSIENAIEISTEVLDLTEVIINRIRQRTDLVFQFSEALDELIYHLSFLLNRLRYRVRLVNPVLDEMKKKFPFAYSIAQIAARTIEEETGLSVSEDETGFLSSYFQLFIEEQDRKKNPPMKVLVLFEGGGASRRLIEHQIRKVFTDETQLTFQPVPVGGHTQAEGYDLVLTTGKVTIPDPGRLITLDEVFDEKILRQRIEKIGYLRPLRLAGQSEVRSVMLTLLDEDRFFIFESDESYEEAVAEMCEALFEESCVDESFEERLRSREEQSSMRFSKDVAFPHTFHYVGESPCMTFGVCPEGLKEDAELRLIILAGLPVEANEDITLVKLYEEILAISDDRQAVKDISRLESYDQLLQYLVVTHPVF